MLAGTTNQSQLMGKKGFLQITTNTILRFQVLLQYLVNRLKIMFCLFHKILKRYIKIMFTVRDLDNRRHSLGLYTARLNFDLDNFFVFVFYGSMMW